MIKADTVDSASDTEPSEDVNDYPGFESENNHLTMEASEEEDEDFDPSEYVDLMKEKGVLAKTDKIHGNTGDSEVDDDTSNSTTEYSENEPEINDDEVKELPYDSNADNANGVDNVTEEGIEASFLSNPEPTWMFFHNGQPFLKLKKSRMSADSHLIFDNARFPEIFLNRVKETTLASAIKDFNGEIFKSKKLINSVDLESMAFERLQSTILPKFQDCMALAIEGSAKGVYSDLNKELKASFYDEFVSRGMPESDTKKAIEASFLNAGPVVFSSIIAKATELMYKKEESYSAIKATIQASGTVNAMITEEDLEKKEFKAKLKAGNLPFSTSEITANSSLNRSMVKTSVNTYRDRIKFK